MSSEREKRDEEGRGGKQEGWFVVLGLGRARGGREGGEGKEPQVAALTFGSKAASAWALLRAGLLLPVRLCGVGCAGVSCVWFVLHSAEKISQGTRRDPLALKTTQGGSAAHTDQDDGSGSHDHCQKDMRMVVVLSASVWFLLAARLFFLLAMLIAVASVHVAGVAEGREVIDACIDAAMHATDSPAVNVPGPDATAEALPIPTSHRVSSNWGLSSRVASPPSFLQEGHAVTTPATTSRPGTTL